MGNPLILTIDPNFLGRPRKWSQGVESDLFLIQNNKKIPIFDAKNQGNPSYTPPKKNYPYQ